MLIVTIDNNQYVVFGRSERTIRYVGGSKTHGIRLLLSDNSGARRTKPLHEGDEIETWEQSILRVRRIAANRVTIGIDCTNVHIWREKEHLVEARSDRESSERKS